MCNDKTFGWSLIVPLIFLTSVGVSNGAAFQEPVNGCPSWGIPIHIHIQGLRNAQGTVKAVLYGPDPKTFLVKGKKADKEREPAEAGPMTLCVAAPENGRYAVVVYHDENDNHYFDRIWVGLPTEGFGVSNNPTLFFAPPSFEESAFEVNGELTHVEVDVKY
jgi:uncharacterized protein (DUF2141 family)